MIPQEKALVKRLQDKPFALLGINSDLPNDSELDALPFEQKLERVRRHVLREVVQKHGLTWRNAIACGTDGPLPTQWNVSGWPMIYVIDASGKIRYRGHDGDEMEKQVDQCLAELSPPPGPPKK